MNLNQSTLDNAIKNLRYNFDVAAAKIVSSNHLTKQFRFPRSKKRRIRKKWAKNPANYKPRQDVLFDQQRGVIYAHPTIAKQLEKFRTMLK